MAVFTPNQYWIRPDALTITLNTPDVDYLRASLLANSVIIAYVSGVIDYDPSHNYRKWILQAADTYLETSNPYYVHAQLTRSEENPTALIVYSQTKLAIDGKVVADDGTESGEPNDQYYYVYLGKISASKDPNGNKVGREWLENFDSGKLDTNQGRTEDMDGHFLSRLFNDSAAGLINFERGISFGNLILKLDENGNLSLTRKDGGKATFWASGGISALDLGEGGNGDGGNSYDRLDSWDDYDAEAGAVLSATLGYELKEAIEGIDLGDFDLSGYAKEEWVKDNYANLEYSVQSFGKINLGMISYTELYNIMKALPSENAIRMFLITDNNGNLPSLSGETVITITDTSKKLLFGKTADFGVSVGDILVVTKNLLKIIPLNDAKAANGDFPGADGLESVWDKGQINRIPTIEALAYAALPKTDRLPSLSATNMDQALQTGVYPWCTLGRPAGSTGAYTCIVNRTSTNDGSYDTIEQTAYGREGELGQIYKRIIFYKSDGTDTQYGEWKEITNVTADKNYVHEQGTAATEWNITHNLGKFPSVTVMDSANSIVVGEVEYVDMNNVILHFSAEFSGRATLN